MGYSSIPHYDESCCYAPPVGTIFGCCCESASSASFVAECGQCSVSSRRRDGTSKGSEELAGLARIAGDVTHAKRKSTMRQRRDAPNWLTATWSALHSKMSAIITRMTTPTS
ncbi:unnamed protein product [Vitrella brassicaformis CCMP3155]|uniref:Uncharacterized protein n=1 Tax=Vitrella brassicaformis (strain CCMP3155) TaxID=1169540 RepID=A0A0G4EHY0_VITBC|nr:unnamed protein product [Vitrella brassicaformis CCMP3155]|eukprot:CEL95549.1 unnamed protein product [Vitrella brassicaformis CCMP3155]